MLIIISDSMVGCGSIAQNQYIRGILSLFGVVGGWGGTL